MLDCIFVCNLNRCVRLVILNLFAVLWKEHRNINILDVTPFLEGWLIRPGKCASIRLFRQTTVVYPHRQLFLCDEKILKEMMLELDDVCLCHEQRSWIIWVCVCFLRREEEENDFFRPPSRCLLLDGCDFGVVCYCCWNRIWSCNCDFCWRRSVRSLTKWSSSDSELLCSTKMLDVWWRLNTFAQLLQSAFPFYCWNSNNWQD